MPKKKSTNGNRSQRIPFRLEWLDPKTGQAHPGNWRTHPASQTEALEELIYSDPDVGWAGVALLNERRTEDGWSKADAVPTFIDGHDRRELALKHGGSLPTIVGSWSPAGERKILATLDPIGQLAVPDPGMLEILLRDIATDEGPLSKMLSEMSRDLDSSALSAPADKRWIENGAGEVQVRPVLRVADVALFERAMKATGERNRASALMSLARSYLEERQLDIPTEDNSPTEDSDGLPTFGSV